MAVRLRPARTSDAVALAGILVDVGWFADRIGADTAAIGRHVESLLPDPEDLTRELVVAADDVEDVVGYAHWVATYPLFLPGPSVYLTELFVHSQARGRGIGTRLLDHVVDRARGIAASRVELLTNVARDSYRRDFYGSRGFSEQGSLAVFRRSIPD